MIVVSDTSPISNLIQIQRLPLLAEVYDDIIVPPQVWKEVLRLEDYGIGLDEFKNAAWIRVVSPSNQVQVGQLLKRLDPGEAEALALAEELGADFVLIDETKGRRVATEMGLSKIGLLGVLIKAKSEGVLMAVQPVMDELRDIAGFWIAETLYQDTLRLADEI